VVPIAGDIISPQDFIDTFTRLTGKKVGVVVVVVVVVGGGGGGGIVVLTWPTLLA